MVKMHWYKRKGTENNYGRIEKAKEEIDTTEYLHMTDDENDDVTVICNFCGNPYSSTECPYCALEGEDDESVLHD